MSQPMSNDCEPRLSSVDCWIDDFVREAIGKLDEQIERYHTPDDVVLDCEPVWRDSTGPAPTTTPRVAE